MSYYPVPETDRDAETHGAAKADEARSETDAGRTPGKMLRSSASGDDVRVTTRAGMRGRPTWQRGVTIQPHHHRSLLQTENVHTMMITISPPSLERALNRSKVFEA